MALPYIDTPRTEVDGNATYLTNGYRSIGRTHLSALDSVENSFQAPNDEDVIKIVNDGRRRGSNAFKLDTARAGPGPNGRRSALVNHNNDRNRRHFPTEAPPKGEFTPLMKSATKNNLLRTLAKGGASDLKTPANLKADYRSNYHTPGLPSMEITDIYEEEPTDNQPTPLPQVASSSAQSTPLPMLPGRDGGGVVSDGQNIMTLKEQEKMIDKLDKDNFGLKLKIHYLQEQLAKMGPGVQQEALKENTELKVTKMTLMRDISRYKKNLLQAERVIEDFRRQVQEMHREQREQQADELLQQEMDHMREDIENKGNQVNMLRHELSAAKDKQAQEIERLRDEIEDLEASLRERDRIIDERDEEIECLKDGNRTNDGAVSDLKAKLESAKQRTEELHERLEQAEFDTRQAKEAEERAIEEKELAEERLRELQDEIADKSFTAKGTSRQLEEKASEYEEKIRGLQSESKVLKEQLEAKAQHEARLEQQFQKVKHEFNEERQRLLDDMELIRSERDVAQEELERVSSQMQEALDDVQRRSAEKALLQTRHYALTEESSSLQSELDKARSTITALQQAAEDNKQRAADTTDALQAHHKEEIERLQDEIQTLSRTIETREGHFLHEKDTWESARRNLQMQKERASEQAAGFKRTIEKLQQIEHTLSGKELKLQEVIDSEKSRHYQEEAVFGRQIKELNEDLVSKRQVIDDQRNELLSVKEDLRIARREVQTLQEKAQALEDEVVVLQASLQEEQEYAKSQLDKGSSNIESQLQKAISDKQDLREQLTKAKNHLNEVRASLVELRAEHEELQHRLSRSQDNDDDTHRFDKEKVDLQRSKIRLEGEVARLKEEKSSLLKAKENIENQLSSEIERASTEENRLVAEIDQLRDALLASSGSKDRELTQARGKAHRLEKRISELEALLEQQGLPGMELSTAHSELSMLRHSLDETRKREKVLLQREADQRASARTFKSRIAELEKELHDALMMKYNTQSPQSSPADKLQEELRNLRRQLSDAHRSLRDLKSRNRELQRTAMKEEEQRDLNELLKASTLEAESLALKLSERNVRVNDLTTQMRRIRDERSFCARKAEKALAELESLQERYDKLLEGVGTQKSETTVRHEMELRGLGKEIIWLRARLRREERFRRDLAWSKGLMELGEQVRAACNEADLRMIADMGVKPRNRSKARPPRRKMKAAVLTVLATVRMQRWSREWTRTKKLGEGLKRAKDEVLNRRKENANGQAV